MYTKKNQSQIQPTSTMAAPKKKAGKDGTLSYSGETTEPSPERGAGSTKDGGKKDKEPEGTGQGPQARRTSIK